MSRGLDGRQLNLTSLSEASVQALLEHLAEAARSPDASGPSAEQLGDYVTGETVRLIRLGTRRELAEASAALSHVLSTSLGETLKEHFPEAHASLSCAADILAVAASPASRGGEFVVLRSFSGRALSAVWHVTHAAGKALARARLREVLAVEESYLSHLLADLETAGLVERIRDGKNVTVHLGARGYMDEVQAVLEAAPVTEIIGAAPPAESASIVREALRAIDAGAHPGCSVPPELSAAADLWDRLVRCREKTSAWRLLPSGEPTLDGPRVCARVTLEGPAMDEPLAAPGELALRLKRTSEDLLFDARVEGGRIVFAELWDRRAPRSVREVPEREPPVLSRHPMFDIFREQDLLGANESGGRLIFMSEPPHRLLVGELDKPSPIMDFAETLS